MFHGLVSGAVTRHGYKFLHALSDIETLNQRALRGELDVTAVSVHAYSRLHEQYAILTSGASMGGVHYGPRLVSRTSFDLADGVVRRLGIPGEMTSAALALKLYLNERGIKPVYVPIHFDQVFDAVSRGDVDAAVVIHEGQLTFAQEGFICLVDLGVWWWQKHSLPLPLGINVVRRSLGPEVCSVVGSVLKESIVYSLEHRREALSYALSYGRGLSEKDADTFVGMYVNDYTVDLGPDGKRSIELFLQSGFEQGILSEEPRVLFI